MCAQTFYSLYGYPRFEIPFRWSDDITYYKRDIYIGFKHLKSSKQEHIL